MLRIAQEIWLMPRNFMIAIMRVYRAVISPLYGDVCKYYPSCSRYAVEAYQSYGFIRGCLMTGWRLLRCNPFSSGGIDDVPAPRREIFFINSRGFIRPRTRKA